MVACKCSVFRICNSRLISVGPGVSLCLSVCLSVSKISLRRSYPRIFWNKTSSTACVGLWSPANTDGLFHYRDYRSPLLALWLSHSHFYGLLRLFSSLHSPIVLFLSSSCLDQQIEWTCKCHRLQHTNPLNHIIHLPSLIPYLMYCPARVLIVAGGGS